MPVAEAVGSDGSSVDELIESFGKTSRASEVPVSDELKSIAGVMQTPGPGRVGNITVVVGDDGPLVRIGGTDSRLMPTIPSRHRARQFSRPDHTQKKWVFGIASVVFVGLSALGFGYQMLKSPHDSFLRRRARHTDSNDGKTALNAVCSASVTLKDCPPESEVLLYLGTAPLDVPRMPVGTRLEFVATLEGHAPRRVVITKDANWDTTPDGKPKYELAMQLDNGPLATNWPAGEPGSEVGGQGPPGLVHIVTTPRAAQIWLVAGLGPEARIEQLPCEDSLKFLVAGPTSFRKTIDVMPDSFTESQVGATHRLRAAIVSAK